MFFLLPSSLSISAAANNPDTVKTLKNVFDAFRTAAKTYSQVRCTPCSTSGSKYMMIYDAASV